MRPSRTLVLAACAIMLSSSVAMAHGSRHRDRCRHVDKNPTPPDFVKTMMFIMNGTIVPPNPETGDPGDEVIDPTPFWTEVFDRDADDIEAHRNAAISFYIERFGIDPDAPEFASSTFLFPFQTNRSANYRAYYISDEPVTAEGWEVVDTGWILVVTDPNGLTLGGQFAGFHVPAGAVMLFGEYYLVPPSDAPRGRRCAPEPIYMTYEAGCPVVPNEFGDILFRCDVHHPEWGQGMAQGVTAPTRDRDDGLQKQNTRNIITFSGLGDDPVILPPRY